MLPSPRPGHEASPGRKGCSPSRRGLPRRGRVHRGFLVYLGWGFAHLGELFHLGEGRLRLGERMTVLRLVFIAYLGSVSWPGL